MSGTIIIRTEELHQLLELLEESKDATEGLLEDSADPVVWRAAHDRAEEVVGKINAFLNDRA